MTTKPLNKAEAWIVDHAVPLFVTIAALILLGAIAVFYTYQRQGDTAHEVHVIAPQVTKINQAICDRASLANDLKAKRCADRIRIGLVNCRHVERCRAALLAAITFPPPSKSSQGPSRQTPPGTTAPSPEGGDAFQPSHHGHQPHGPGSQPGPSTPSPQPPAAPTAPGSSGEAPGHTGENPGQGGAEPPGQSGANHGQASGVGAEVCVLEQCVGAEVGLGLKGVTE